MTFALPPARPPRPADLVGGGTLACDSKGETTVFIFKTVSEPKVGTLSYFKVFSGTLRSSDELINAKNRTAERFGSIYIANGKDRQVVDHLMAGDIGVTVKLKKFSH